MPVPLVAKTVPLTPSLIGRVYRVVVGLSGARNAIKLLESVPKNLISLGLVLPVGTLIFN